MRRNTQDRAWWKLATLLTLAALPGVAAMSWLTLPRLIDTSTLPLPLSTLQWASALQTTLFVLLAAFAGAATAPATLAIDAHVSAHAIAFLVHG